MHFKQPKSCVDENTQKMTPKQHNSGLDENTQKTMQFTQPQLNEEKIEESKINEKTVINYSLKIFTSSLLNQNLLLNELEKELNFSLGEITCHYEEMTHINTSALNMCFYTMLGVNKNNATQIIRINSFLFFCLINGTSCFVYMYANKRLLQDITWTYALLERTLHYLISFRKCLGGIIIGQDALTVQFLYKLRRMLILMEKNNVNLDDANVNNYLLALNQLFHYYVDWNPLEEIPYMSAYLFWEKVFNDIKLNHPVPLPKNQQSTRDMYKYPQYFISNRLMKIFFKNFSFWSYRSIFRIFNRLLSYYCHFDYNLYFRIILTLMDSLCYFQVPFSFIKRRKYLTRGNPYLRILLGKIETTADNSQVYRTERYSIMSFVPHYFIAALNISDLKWLEEHCVLPLQEFDDIFNNRLTEMTYLFDFERQDLEQMAKCLYFNDRQIFVGFLSKALDCNKEPIVFEPFTENDSQTYHLIKNIEKTTRFITTDNPLYKILNEKYFTWLR